MPRIFYIEDISRHFGITVWTARQWVREGKFPGARKLGRTWYVPADAVAAVFDTEQPEASRSRKAGQAE